jgi:hypothetical protein
MHIISGVRVPRQFVVDHTLVFISIFAGKMIIKKKEY